MKKYYTIASLALLVAASGIALQDMKEPNRETVDVTAVMARTGTELMASLRQDVQAGRYDAFLAELDQDYRQLTQEGRLEEFMKMREAPPMDERLERLAREWEVLHQTLVKERDAELKAVCQGKEDQLIAKRVDSVISELPDDQTEALYYLSALRFKTIDQAVNVDEKKLIEIDLASEFKTLHLDMQFAAKPFESRAEKHIVIKMDMLRQMAEASQTFTDQNLKKKVDLAVQAFDHWQARSWDLNKLSTTMKKPANDLEKKVGSILADYKTKKEDLYQKEFLAKLDTDLE